MNTKKVSHRVIVFASAVLIAFSAVSARAATNDLTITSITHEDGCTTLNWRSHPGEYYRVFYSDVMNNHVFWRVAAFCVPSGGTNTSWSEGCESSMMMSQGGGQQAKSGSQLSEEQLAQRREEHRIQVLADIEYIESKLMEAEAAAAGLFESLESGGNQMNLLDGPPVPGEDEPQATNGTFVVSARFFRVARIPHGFGDGWGPGLGTLPSTLTNVVAMSPSGRGDSNAFPYVHTLALRCDGSVTAWGATNWGQTTVPTNLSGVVAIAAGGRHSVALKQDGTITTWGDNSLGQITNAPPGLTNVVSVKAGLWHTIALKANGTVAVWGDLFNQSNAVPPGVSNVIAIAAGPRHCLALLSNRTVRGWGFSYPFLNNYLPTNSPSWLTNIVAISAGMEHNQAMRADGTVLVWGNSNNLGMSLPAGITNATAIAAGWHYGHALLANGSVADWGQTDVGIGAGMDDVVAVSAGARHTVAIRTNSEGLRIVRQPGGINLPIGTNAALSVAATNRAGTTLAYLWEKNGSTLTAATNSILTFAALNDNDDGIYRVRVSSGAISMWSRPATVTNIHPPVITNQTPELDLRRPQGTKVDLRVFAQSKGRAPSFAWYQNGTNLGSADPDSLIFSSRSVKYHGLTVEGTYWAVVSNPAGSATSQVWTVKVTLRGEVVAWGNNSWGQTTTDRSETNLIAIAGGGHHSLALRRERHGARLGRQRLRSDQPAVGSDQCGGCRRRIPFQHGFAR